MKSSLGLIAAGLLLGATTQTQAAVDVRAALAGGYAEIEAPGLDAKVDDFVGGDFRARFQANEHVFLRGQYLTMSGDEFRANGQDYYVDTDLDVLRLGAGYGSDWNAIRLYAAAEYVDLELGLDGESDGTDGFGASVGIGDQGGGNWVWNVELTALFLDDLRGAGLDASIGYRFTPMFTGLIGVQSYALEDKDDSDNEFNFGQTYIGVQLSF
jgi:hypothetical protein